jgi:TATA-box binding protein (TBP) (component of TFIID and TFIIIB)
MELDNEWEQFITNTTPMLMDEEIDYTTQVPKSSELYISTNTIISYFSEEIPLIDLFWKLKVIPYHEPREGIIKKQIKLISQNKSELEGIDTNIHKTGRYGYRTTIKHIENEKGNIKYKNISKITIGMSKKDIISYRIKQKGAFYNCFVLILRVCINDQFKEFHIKIFNTGKIEIPGIQDKSHLTHIIKILMAEIQLYFNISYNKENEQTVLINSNFNCGYYINRDSLYNKLRYDKNISAVYDPCSYPGIQCKLYYTENEDIVTTPVPGNIVSFMIFRTGSILIVGKCTVTVIHKIYNYIIQLLNELFHSIVDYKCKYVKTELIKKKIKKTILINNDLKQ